MALTPAVPMVGGYAACDDARVVVGGTIVTVLQRAPVASAVLAPARTASLAAASDHIGAFAAGTAAAG